MKRLKPLPPSEPLPQDFRIAQAIASGFYQCKRCNGLITHLNEKGERLCSRCQSPFLKFHQGINNG